MYNQPILNNTYIYIYLIYIDIMDRGDDWKDKKKKALIRDKYTCRICGKTSLSVHHLIPFRERKINVINELITVCSSCHKKIENKYLRYGLTNYENKYIEENRRLIYEKNDKYLHK